MLAIVVGLVDGSSEGCGSVGVVDGGSVGIREGKSVGLPVGLLVGALLGCSVGSAVGLSDGAPVGLADGVTLSKKSSPGQTRFIVLESGKNTESPSPHSYRALRPKTLEQSME